MCYCFQDELIILTGLLLRFVHRNDKILCVEH